MTTRRPVAVVILAAGEGTRMRSSTPKVLHRIGGRTLLGHAISAARGTGADHVEVVVRHAREQVVAFCQEYDDQLVIADQDDVKGTGRAVECGLDELPDDLAGTVLVTYGDVPLLTADTLRELTAAHDESGSSVSVVTARVPDPTGYGRVIRDVDGQVERIVEQKDATPDEAAIDEINSGIYAFDVAVLRAALDQVGTDNAQGEKYITDVVRIARESGHLVRAHVIDDVWQTEGVNDRVQLATLGAELNARVCRRWMREGVTIVDPATTWLDADVALGRDCRILPGTQLLGATTIGAEVVIGPDTTLDSCEVGDRAVVIRTHATLARVGAEATVGPYAVLHPGSDIAPGDSVGPFTDRHATTEGDPQ
ncbi:MAG: NTP transferase domain-containing protein [Candidatus Lutibacillus vidarii]